MRIMETKLCNDLYEEVLGQDGSYTVEEEMLCVRNVSREKGICHVSDTSTVGLGWPSFAACLLSQ